MGEESWSGAERTLGRLGRMSMEELVGVPSMGCGVVWNSASVPFSVSSRHLTPRLTFDGDFFFGVN